jgi:hypothetical protein
MWKAVYFPVPEIEKVPNFEAPEIRITQRKTISFCLKPKNE